MRKLKNPKEKTKFLFRLFKGIGEKLPRIKSFFTCLFFLLCVATSISVSIRFIRPISSTLAILVSSLSSSFFFIPVVIICYTKNIFPSYKESLNTQSQKQKEEVLPLTFASISQTPVVRRIYRLGLWEETRSGQVCYREPIGSQREQKFMHFGKRYRQEMLVVLGYKAVSTCGIDLEKVSVQKTKDNKVVIYGLEAQSIAEPSFDVQMEFGEVREISYEKESTGRITKVVSNYSKENENLLLKKKDFYVNKFKEDFTKSFDSEIRKSRKEFVESFIRAEFGPRYQVEFENEAAPANALPFNDFLKSEHTLTLPEKNQHIIGEEK